MKTPLTTLTETTTIGWSMLLGNQPTTPVLTPAGKAPRSRRRPGQAQAGSHSER